MESVAIPPANWRDRLAELEHQHRGQPVVLEEGMKVLARGGSLRSLLLTEPAAGHPRVCIDIAECGPPIHHEVVEPVRLLLEQPEPSGGGWLRIDAADHSTTVLQFDVPVLPREAGEHQHAAPAKEPHPG